MALYGLLFVLIISMLWVLLLLVVLRKKHTATLHNINFMIKQGATPVPGWDKFLGVIELLGGYYRYLGAEEAGNLNVTDYLVHLGIGGEGTDMY